MYRTQEVFTTMQDSKLKVFPYTKKGLTQDKWSKLRITNQGRSMLDKAKNSRKLRESVIGKYIETW